MAWLCNSYRRGALALIVAAAAGCFDSGSRPPKVVEPAPPVVIDLTTHYQRIDGFGASSAWTANNLTDAMADLFFSTETGIGLSLLRIQIKPEGNTFELPTAQKAAARGAKVWAAPWSPPGEWKTNGMARNGGSLLDEHRQDWANRLATFASTMSAQGIPLVALSAQNEPNYANAGWETCIFTAPQLVTFMRDFLAPALAAQGQTVPIMAPEVQGWDRFDGYATALMADPATVAVMGPLATHYYGGVPHGFPAADAAGKAIWETEISDDKVNKNLDTTIASGMRVAQMIHDNLVLGNVSAWHYWWLMPDGKNNNGALASSSALLPRAWAFGNWSRFVRPGFVRVGATPTSQSYLFTTAFVDAAGTRIVVVAANQANYDLDQDFTITGGTASEVTPWVTSATRNLQAQAALPVVDGTFSVTLPPRSVTTFVGTVTP